MGYAGISSPPVGNVIELMESVSLTKQSPKGCQSIAQGDSPGIRI